MITVNVSLGFVPLSLSLSLSACVPVIQLSKIIISHHYSAVGDLWIFYGHYGSCSRSPVCPRMAGLSPGGKRVEIEPVTDTRDTLWRRSLSLSARPDTLGMKFASLCHLTSGHLSPVDDYLGCLGRISPITFIFLKYSRLSCCMQTPC